jgi:tetratricopeptide (TPR) repeat protein
MSCAPWRRSAVSTSSRQSSTSSRGMPPSERRSSVPAVLISLAEELDTHGHAESARQVLRRAVAWQRARSRDAQQAARARSELARALYLLGEYDAAEPLFKALSDAAPADRRFLLQLGLIAARRGRPNEVAEVAERLRALKGPCDHGETALALARLSAALGDPDVAVGLLRQALGEGVGYGTWLHANTDLTPLRADPRFRELVKPSG